MSRSRHPPRARVFALLTCLVLAALHPLAQESPRQVKASFLTRFGHFVEWPSDLKTTPTVFGVCLSDGHPFGRTLETLSSGMQVRGLDMRVRYVSNPEVLSGCHVLYVTRPAGEDEELLNRARTLPILTVGEHDQFLTRGGIIRLFQVGDRVHFDVNLRNAQRAKLQVSAELLQLARTVQGVD